MKGFWKNLSASYAAWSDDQAITLSAALSYYMIFSLAPLILIAVAIAGLVWGQEASRGEIFGALNGLLGSDGAKSVQSFVEASSLKKAGILATIIGGATLLLGATSVFAQLQDSLNLIWKVKRKPGKGVFTIVRQRLLSFSLILVIAFLLLVSLLLSALLAAVGQLALVRLPGGEWVWHIVDIILSFSLTSVLFAAIYKILPDIKLRWKDVIRGGIMTALFFTIGKTLIGIYIGHAGLLSTFGAAGSIALILVWTYYSSAVLFFGAEYTKIHTLSRNRDPMTLKEGAEWLKGSGDQSPWQVEPTLTEQK
jgi:membrane protein